MTIKDDLKPIYTAAIDAVNPKNAVESHVQLQGSILQLLSNRKIIKKFDLNSFNKIFIVGAGKATSAMAAGIENILAQRISKGSICVKYGYLVDLSRIEIIEASHPIPDANGVKASKTIRDILDKAGKNDLVISLISGGGSALLPLPPDKISLEEKGATTDLLLKSGASIHEINSIRKHLSLVKGGNLAKAAYPATVINLMISDVVGDNMDVIASGPFVPDNSTFKFAKSILEKYKLTGRAPNSVINYINEGLNGKVEENPGENSNYFDKVTNLIIASNIIALKAARDEAVNLGYNSIILSSLFEGDTKENAEWHSKIAKEIINSSNPVKAPACIISGGETTVIVKGDGLGGRNMEFAIQSANFINGLENVLAASIGTDGTDGPTDAAGAFSDGETVKRSKILNLEINKYIENNDSYNFFKKLGDLIITGPTNTNVMDVRLIIVGK